MAHLWLGITVGCLFGVAGVTGSVLVYYVEADAALHPAVAQRVHLPAPPSYERLYRGLRVYAPELQGPWRIEAAERGAVSARYYKTEAAARRGFAPLVVWSDPLSGQVVRQAQWGETVVTWTYDLHYALLLGPAGKLLMAAGGVLCLVLLVGGVWLWWPTKGKWRSALTIKPSASPQRRIYDLHKTAGVYGLAQLTVLTLTGVLLAAPGWFEPLVAPVEAPQVRSIAVAGQQRIPVDEAIALARRRFPQASVRWIETPDGPRGVYRINLRQPGEPGRRFPRTNVWLDQYSGEIRAVSDARRAPASAVMQAWLHPIHSGEAGGWLGRMAVLATGLGAPALLLTGLIRRGHKQRARRLAKAKASVAAPRRSESDLSSRNDR